MPNLRAERLFRGDLVAISDVRCRGGGSSCGAEEQAGTHQVVFTRAGLFVKHVGGRRIFGEPTQAIFFNRGECYRVSHPNGIGDDCTVLTFSAETIVQVLAACQQPDAQLEVPFQASHARVDLGIFWRYQELRRTLRAGWATPLQVEETALELLASLLCAARHRPPRGQPGATARRRELVEAVQLMLASQPGARQSLAGLARSLDCSPFHLTRVFREEVGLPVHRYLLRLRLAATVERLVNGERNLSALACDLGFTSHSHLTSVFHRSFGMTPSGFRRTYSASKNVKAGPEKWLDVSVEARLAANAPSGYRPNVTDTRYLNHAAPVGHDSGRDRAASPAHSCSGRNPH